MPLSAGSDFQIRVYCTRGDQTAINVLNYQVGALSGVSEVNEQDMIDSFSTHVATAYKAAMSASATYYGADLRVRTGSTFGPSFHSTNGQGVGSNLFDVLPRQVCGLISWKANASGRKGNGRTFVPFPDEASNGGSGVPSSGYLDELAQVRDALGPAPEFSLSTGSTVLNLHLLDRAAGTTVEVLSGTARPKWATQRRRGDFGKINAPSF